MTKDLQKRRENFLENARRVHGQKYSYDISKYQNMGKKIPITCPKHGVFIQTARDHIHSKAGCKDCGIESRTNLNIAKTKASKKTFGDKYPELLKQWDYQKNTIDPFALGTGKRIKIHWICIRGHKTYSDLRNKIAGSGCKYCSKAVSKLEAEVYSLVKALFPDAEWNTKLFGKEADIFVPSLKLIIEVDGYPWHNTKDSLRRDNLKTKTFVGKAYQIIRFRDRNNQAITGDVFEFDYLNLEIELEKFFELIAEKFSVDTLKDEIFSIKKKIFQDLLDRHPKPPSEKSLAGIFPKIKNFWDVDNLMMPDAVHYGSHDEVKLQCSQCRNKFARLAKLVKWPILCATCAQSASGAKRVRAELEKGKSLKSLYSSLAEEWSVNNKSKPEDYLAGSPEVVLWTCKIHGDYPSAIRDRVRNNSGCHKCGRETAAKKILKTYLVTSTNENSPTIRLKGIEAVASLVQCSKSMVSKMLKNKTEYKGYKVRSEPD